MKKATFEDKRRETKAKGYSKPDFYFIFDQFW